MNAQNWEDGVPRGWRQLVCDLVRDLDAIAARDGLSYEIMDMKEKFGTLRVSLTVYTPEMDARVEQAEEASEEICSGCGGPAGNLRRHRGWVTNLCPICKTTDDLIMDARRAATRGGSR